MTGLELIIIFITGHLFHWIADFVLQSNSMASGKSKNSFILMDHCGLYSLIMTIWFVFFVSYNTSDWLGFTFLTFSIHFMVDFITSRINSFLWNEKRTHDFFVSVGFDQFIHFSTLILSVWLIAF